MGYLYGIRSERRLCEEVHLNVAFHWFCRLDLTDRVPDHSTFSMNRHGRFRQCDLHRHLFEEVVARCMAAGLVAGTDLAVDGKPSAGGREPSEAAPRRDCGGRIAGA